MKGASVVLSAIIVAATTLTITVAALTFSDNVLKVQLDVSEYEQAKNMLISTVYFNLTVYSFSNTAQPTSFSVYNRKMISNSASQTAFTDTPEISSAAFLYVAHNSKIYLLRLQLAEGGVGSY